MENEILSVLLKITPDLETKAIETPLNSPDGNNVVQNGCSFHGLRSEDPNQHLKDFLKLVDLLFLYVANRHGLDSRTYSKKSLIMVSIFGFKSKSFLTMSIPLQDAGDNIRIFPDGVASPASVIFDEKKLWSSYGSRLPQGVSEWVPFTT
nr:MAK10-like protein [Tanacetum cinerariifolium]